MEVKVQFFQVDGQWDAWSDEAGLAGYGNESLSKVREAVFDAIKFSLDREDINFVEEIIEVEE